MPMDVRFSREEGLIRVRCHGALTVQETRQGAQVALDLVNGNGCFRVLADVRDLACAYSVSEIYNLPAFFRSIGVPPRVRTAVVAPMVRRQPDDIRFYENVCVNNGFTTQTFEDVESAEKWLRS